MKSQTILILMVMFLEHSVHVMGQGEDAPFVEWTDLVGVLKQSKFVCVGRVTGFASTTNSFTWGNETIPLKSVLIDVETVIKGVSTNTLIVHIPAIEEPKAGKSDIDQLLPVRFRTNSVYILLLRISPWDIGGYELDAKVQSIPGEATIPVTDLVKVLKQGEKWVDQFEKRIGIPEGAGSVSYWRHVETCTVLKKILGRSGQFPEETGRLLRKWWNSRVRESLTWSEDSRGVTQSALSEATEGTALRR